jgi:peroxiredoxin
MKILPILSGLVFALCLGALRPPVALAGSPTAAALKLTDLDGKRVDPWAAGGAETTVFVFVRTDCPIADAYAPELRRLHGEFSARGVAFWLVYLDREESSAAIAKHLRAFDLPLTALRDGDHAVAKLCGARVTPEAALFHQRQLVYLGRIDDRYLAPGKPRPEATAHDLEEAVNATLAGRAPARASAPAIGCSIADLP